MQCQCLWVKIMSSEEIMKKAKEPEGEKNTTRRWPRGRKYRYQTKCLAQFPGRIFHTYQGQATQAFLKINPVCETRYLNKQQKILPLSFLWILWLLIRAFGQWLRQRVPVRKLQSNTGISKPGISKPEISKRELRSAGSAQSPEGTLANHEEEKAPYDQKGIAVPCRVVLGKSLNNKTELS